MNQESFFFVFFHTQKICLHCHCRTFACSYSEGIWYKWLYTQLSPFCLYLGQVQAVSYTCVISVFLEENILWKSIITWFGKYLLNGDVVNVFCAILVSPQKVTIWIFCFLLCILIDFKCFAFCKGQEKCEWKQPTICSLYTCWLFNPRLFPSVFVEENHLKPAVFMFLLTSFKWEYTYSKWQPGCLCLREGTGCGWIELVTGKWDWRSNSRGPWLDDRWN